MPGAPPAGAPNPMVPLICNAVTAILCCHGVYIFTIVGAILAWTAKTALDQGNVELARKRVKISWILFAVDWGLAVIFGIIYGVMTALANH